MAAADGPVIGSNSDDLRIAWRYNDLPKVDAEQRNGTSTHSFDLTTQIEAADLSALNISTFGQQSAGQHDSTAAVRTDGFQNALYARLLTAIRGKIAGQQPTNLLRISLSGVGGPLWYDTEMSADLCRFLTLLRALLRGTPVVCCLSMPTHLLQWHVSTAFIVKTREGLAEWDNVNSIGSLQDDRLVHRVRNCVDMSLQLESFAGSERETNPIFAEYHGLLHIRQLRALNTLAAGTPATHDLAFKLRRRQFVVEKLHLPPELQEESAAGAADAHPTMGCGGGGGQSLLDF